MAFKLSKKTWWRIYTVTALLTPIVCALVFLKELTKCDSVPLLVSLYILEIFVCLLFLPSYKIHHRQPFFIGWLLSLFGVIGIVIISGVWDRVGIILVLSVPIIPLFALLIEPFASKLKYHLLARVICVGLIALIRCLL